MASELEVGDVKATNKVVVTKNQQTTTGTPFSGAALKLLPPSGGTTNTTGVSSIALSTSVTDNYGFLISGHRAGSDGTPTLRVSSHNNSNTGTEVLTITNTGLATFSGGINLGDETITKYDEGTFIPSLQFGGATTGITYNVIRGGVYTRIGRLVYVQIAFALTSKGTATGDATIAGMPFTCGDLISNTSLENAFAFSNFSNMSVMPSAYITGTTMTLRTLSGTMLNNTDFVDSTSIRIAGCYAIASS